MKTYRQTSRVTQAIDKVLCNQCGRKIDADLNKKHHEEYLSVHHTWGYYSPHDLEIWEFDLCVQCAEKFIQGLKIQKGVKRTADL